MKEWFNNSSVDKLQMPAENSDPRHTENILNVLECWLQTRLSLLTSLQYFTNVLFTDLTHISIPTLNLFGKALQNKGGLYFNNFVLKLDESTWFDKIQEMFILFLRL